MIIVRFASPKSIVASMTQRDFSNPNGVYKAPLHSRNPFFNNEFTQWYLNQWDKGFKFSNVRSSLEYHHRVIVTLEK